MSLRLPPIGPGLILSCVVAAAAAIGEPLQIAVFGRSWAESLILAIVFGLVVGWIRRPSISTRPGLQFCSKTLLEVAIVLLGASVSANAVWSAGAALVLGIAVVVVSSLVLTILIGRAFGLSLELSVLIACGNSICGNSAIVATAPVINACSEDVAVALAFTAFLGVIAVLVLPMIHFYGGASATQYGIVAGMSVYAVPQVLAATVPVGLASVQMGTVVKLVRVIMLGPILVGIAPFFRERTSAEWSGKRRSGTMVPWFIIGFFVAMTLRSIGAIPDAIVSMIGLVTNTATIISMAALGLSVDIRDVTRAGGRVITVATISLLVLIAMSLVLMEVLSPI